MLHTLYPKTYTPNPKHMKILLYFFLIGLSLDALAQNITGQVTDAQSGEALEGALLLLKNSHYSTLSNADGQFSIRVKNLPDTLTVHLLGYRQREIYWNRDSRGRLDIRLQALANKLEEVVVATGYQELPAERSTGSFAKIDSALFHRQVSGDVISRLDGISPAILFDKRNGRSTDFSIRGLSTLTESTKQPLIVLDNFPYEGDIGQINPNDVESITLLKDAAAASIWGSRAGNGVLVITTKKGRYKSALRASFAANTTLTAKPDLWALPQMSSKDFIEVENFLYGKGYYQATLDNVYGRPIVSPLVEMLDRQARGLTDQQAVDAAIAKWENTDSRNDFLKYLYRQGVQQQYALNVSGGTADYRSYSSLGYDRQLQNQKGDDNSRLSLKTEQSWKALKNLELTGGISYTQSLQHSNSPGAYGSLVPGGGKGQYYPYLSLADEDGQALKIPRDYRMAYTDTAGQGQLLDWAYRPLDELHNADNSSLSRDVLLKIGAKYRLLPGLSAESHYQYEYTHNKGLSNYSPESYQARNLINLYSSISNGKLTRNIPYGGILDRSVSDLNAYAIRGQLNYQKQFAQNHELYAIAGTELRQSELNTSSYRAYGYDADLLTTQQTDLINAYPTYDGLLGTLNIPVSNNDANRNNRFVSLFANAAYTYRHRYHLSASARRDASNLFGVSSNHKWAPLWSAGMAWDIHQENFFRIGWINQLKLRATYGYSGNVNNTISALTTLRYSQPLLGINSITGLPFAIVVNPPNPDLRPEKVATANFGLDFSLLQSRLSGSIEYYRKRAVDVISLVPLDPTVSGSTAEYYNSAILQNKGWDLSLHSQNFKTAAYSWQSSLLFSYNTNKVEKYLYRPSSYNSYLGNGNTISPIEGYHAYSVVSYKYAGLDDQGDPLVYLNGAPSKDYNAINNSIALSDLVFHGPNLPLYFGSLRNDFGWKAWSLSVNLTYRFHYWFKRNSIGYSQLFGNWIGHADYNRRWRQPGDERFTSVPAMVYPADYQRDNAYLSSDVLVLPGDNIRLQDMRLAYTLPKKKMKQWPLQQLQVYVYASNLGILWRANHLGIDPDTGGNTWTAPASIAFGLQLNL